MPQEPEVDNIDDMEFGSSDEPPEEQKTERLVETFEKTVDERTLLSAGTDMKDSSSL